MQTEEYRVAKVERRSGDARLGLTLQTLQIDDELLIYLIPNAGRFDSAEVTINNKNFTCTLHQGGERILLCNEAIDYLHSQDTSLIVNGEHSAQFEENFSMQLAEIKRKPLPLPKVVLDLEK